VSDPTLASAAATVLGAAVAGISLLTVAGIMCVRFFVRRRWPDR
jgi:hypothetical protein